MENTEVLKTIESKFGDMQKALAERDARIENMAKQIALMDKGMKLNYKSERDRGKGYGFLNAKKDIAIGFNALAPYWDTDTSKRFGEYMKAVHEGDKSYIAKAFGDNPEDATSVGWTPEEFRPELIRLIFAQSVMLPKVTIVPMTREVLNMPRPTPNSGGDYMQEWMTVGRADRGSALLDSKFTADKLSMKAVKAYVLGLVDKEDLMDPAYNFGSYLAAQMAADMAIYIDKVILTSNHSASGTYDWDNDGIQYGVYNFDVSHSHQTTGAVDASGKLVTVYTYANLQKMFKGLNELTAQGAEWIMSPTGKYIVRTMGTTFPVGESSSVAFGESDLPKIPITQPYDFPLWGFPVTATSRLPSIDGAGNAGKLAAVLGNFKYMYFGDRMSFGVDTSEHYRFANDQVVFRGLARFGIGCGVPIAFNTLVFGATS